MAKLSLYYPVKPYSLNQGFAQNAAYYARFHDQFGNPEKGHNGNDLMASHGQPVYAATDGLAAFGHDEHGGEGIYIRTTQLYDYGTTQAYYRIINWHLIGDTDPKYVSPIPMDGKEYPVKAGDLIGYADNTGAPFESSGDHLHMGVIPINVYGNAIEPANGFNGCVDPAQFFNGFCAVDANKVITNLTLQVKLLAQVLALFKSLKKGG